MQIFYYSTSALRVNTKFYSQLENEIWKFLQIDKQYTYWTKK